MQYDYFDDGEDVGQLPPKPPCHHHCRAHHIFAYTVLTPLFAFIWVACAYGLVWAFKRTRPGSTIAAETAWLDLVLVIFASGVWMCLNLAVVVWVCLARKQTATSVLFGCKRCCCCCEDDDDSMHWYAAAVASTVYSKPDMSAETGVSQSLLNRCMFAPTSIGAASCVSASSSDATQSDPQRRQQKHEWAVFPSNLVAVPQSKYSLRAGVSTTSYTNRPGHIGGVDDENDDDDEPDMDEIEWDWGSGMYTNAGLSASLPTSFN